MKELLSHTWILKGYDSPPSILSSREPLSLPLDDAVIRHMTGFNSGSAAAIKEQLTQILQSDAYQRTAMRVQSAPIQAREPPMQRLRGLYKKRRASEGTELESLAGSGEVGEEKMGKGAALVGMYYLAREKCYRERGG